MKNLKKFLALGLAVCMTLSVAACGKTGSNDGNGGSSNNGSTPSGHNSEITIGTWWVQYYDSSQSKVEDDPSYAANVDAEGDDDAKKEEKAFNRGTAEKKLANVKKIEEKYDVKFYWTNLTYNGVKESINNSILAGTPDCDIYVVEPGFGIPAQYNGLAIDLKTILPEDHDIFTTQKVASYLDLGDGKACLIKQQAAEQQVADTYPLAFNVQMLEENNLEDPRDLWERGEWTWDKFNEYMKVLTQDTDGDGQTDQYGYCGYENETFEQLCMSNGTGVAGGQTETLSSAATGEVLQEMYDMYNTWNVCYPYDFEGSPSDSMRGQYREGNIGFFPAAAWILADKADYDYDGSKGTTLPFDIAFVRWPVGPNGNKDTNPGKNDVAGACYIIPTGVQEPELVFNVLYDMWNWFDGDTSQRDNKAALNWWYLTTGKTADYQNANFAVMQECGSKTTFDLIWTLGVNYDLQSLIKGEMTPAQIQETHKQEVQDGLDAYYK